MQFKIKDKSNFQNRLKEHCNSLGIAPYQQIFFYPDGNYFIAELQDSFIKRLTEADPDFIQVIGGL
jgi:hypothetical protein